MNPAKLVKLIKTEINNQSIPVEIIEHVHKNTFRIKITPGSFHTNWKQIYKLVDRVKPAYVIYTIFMYDLSKFYVPISTDSKLNIISDFYVRKGAVPWFLNGSELLNTDIYLNGYKSNIEIDYYPLNLLIKDYIDVKVDYFHRIKYPLSFKVDTKQDSRLNIISDFEVRHIPSTLYIDGNWLTDGTYGLNGYTEDVYPDYYPLKLLIKNNIKATTETQTRYKHISSVSKDVSINNATKFISSANISPSSKSNFNFKSEYKTNVKYGENSNLTINKNLWYLNGSFFLDGENNLNPTTNTYKI